MSVVKLIVIVFHLPQIFKRRPDCAFYARSSNVSSQSNATKKSFCVTCVKRRHRRRRRRSAERRNFRVNLRPGWSRYTLTTTRNKKGCVVQVQCDLELILWWNFCIAQLWLSVFRCKNVINSKRFRVAEKSKSSPLLRYMIIWIFEFADDGRGVNGWFRNRGVFIPM